MQANVPSDNGEETTVEVPPTPDDEHARPEDFAGERVADPWEVSDGQLDSGAVSGNPAV
jgi:hypothetical protein